MNICQNFVKYILTNHYNIKSIFNIIIIMEQFKTNENKALLWDLISENITLDNNGKHYIYNLFNQNYNPFYQNQFNTCSSLIELNKKYIMFIRTNINEYDHKSKLVTHEDIQKNKVNQFDIEYQNQKNDFDSSINIKTPPVPDFKIKMEDEPLKETDKLIQEMIKSRNYEIDKVYQKNDIVTKNTNKLDTPSLDTPSLDTPSLDTRNLKNSNNITYIKINEELDNNIYEKEVEILDNDNSKHISWADQTIQPSISIFDKLKRKPSLNSNIDEEIIFLHKKIDKLDEKIERIISLLEK